MGSEEEEAEINEVFLREEVMIKTSRVEPHANIKGHRMSKYKYFKIEICKDYKS